MEGKTARGASSPAKPALHIPDPLSTTSAAISSSMAELLRGGKDPLNTRVSHPPPSPPPPAVHSEISLPVKLSRSSRGWPLGGARAPHSDQSQTKGSGAAFCYYHIRTWFGFEQLCGYRRHGARPDNGTAHEEKRNIRHRQTRDHSLHLATLRLLPSPPPIVAQSHWFLCRTKASISLRHRPQPFHSLTLPTGRLTRHFHFSLFNYCQKPQPPPPQNFKYWTLALQEIKVA